MDSTTFRGSLSQDIPRRKFLQLVAAGSVGLPAMVRGAPASRPNLGFSLYGMKTLPLDVALKACAEIGYSHVEFALNTGYATEPAVFSSQARRLAAAQLKELQLGLPCMMVHFNLTVDDKAHAQALDLIAAASQMGRDLVPDQPPIIETILGGNPARWDEQKSGMADKLRDWAETAEQARTIIAIKAHIGSAVNSPERLLWLLDTVKSPAIQIAYDYSHFQLQGIGLEESLQLLLPRTRFIHVKDSVGDANKFQFVLPGEGKTDYVQYFSHLRKHGYSGPMCVEVSSQVFNKPGYDPIAAARKCYDTLSTAAKNAE